MTLAELVIAIRSCDDLSPQKKRGLVRNLHGWAHKKAWYDVEAEARAKGESFTSGNYQERSRRISAHPLMKALEEAT